MSTDDIYCSYSWQLAKCLQNANEVATSVKKL